MLFQKKARHRDQGANVYYETVQGRRTDELVFRTSPGRIYSRAHPYTHAVIRFDRLIELELHIGVMVAGTSGVLHECDLALITRSEGITCRSQNVHPRCAAVALAAECKFYASTLPLDLGRSFLGLTGEIHKQGRYFITNSDSDSVVSLLNHHKLEWDVRVLPGRAEATSLLQSFGRKLRNYRTA